MNFNLGDPYFWIAVVIGYLLGSIPFGLLLTRLAGHGDVRSIGSGNIGATNVLRTGNKLLAGLTFLGDTLKGTAAVLVGGALAGPVGAMIGGLSAFIGHLAPVWLGFRGGKGVSTYLGVTLGLLWPAVFVFALVWLTTAFTTRYSSLAALLASIATTGSLFILGQPAIGVLLGVMTVLIFVRHSENIRRLCAGTESRIGRRG